MPQPTACPSCAEPPEPDDKFCGACGTELTSPGPLPRGSTAASTPPEHASDEPDEYHLAPPERRPSEEPTPRHDRPRPRDHQEQELRGVAVVSDRGLRHDRNEDAFAVSTTALPDGTPAVVAVVCDGVSSAYRPDDASAAAAESAKESLLEALQRGTPFEDAMRDALLTAGRAVTDLAAEDPGPNPAPHHNAPACTCVSTIASGKVLTVGWIGDSRAYWIPDDRSTPATRLTEDDSWAALMVSAGLTSKEEAYADSRAHAITGWLGADSAELDPHTASFEPDGPGVVVVCTDGLWNYAESAEELASAVPADAGAHPLRCAQVLVGVALDGGGRDNVTVAVLPFPAPAGQAAHEHT